MNLTRTDLISELLKGSPGRFLPNRHRDRFPVVMLLCFSIYLITISLILLLIDVSHGASGLDLLDCALGDFQRSNLRLIL